LNKLNVASAAAVFGTGLVLFFEFHVGDGAWRESFLNVPKTAWLDMHRGVALIFLAGAAAHIAMHGKYAKTIARRWGGGLSAKLKARSIRQVFLFEASAVVTGTGLYLWTFHPGAGLYGEGNHHILDVHNIIGLLMFVGVTAHIAGRWRRIFSAGAKAAAVTARAGGGDVSYMRGAAILFHNPFGRHTATNHVRVDVGKCDACGACTAACGNDVLELIDLRIHKHVHVSRRENCRGCKKCVAACTNGAFSPVLGTECSAAK